MKNDISTEITLNSGIKNLSLVAVATIFLIYFPFSFYVLVAGFIAGVKTSESLESFLNLWHLVSMIFGYISLITTIAFIIFSPLFYYMVRKRIVTYYALMILSVMWAYLCYFPVIIILAMDGGFLQHLMLFLFGYSLVVVLVYLFHRRFRIDKVQADLISINSLSRTVVLWCMVAIDVFALICGIRIAIQ